MNRLLSPRALRRGAALLAFAALGGIALRGLSRPPAPAAVAPAVPATLARVRQQAMPDFLDGVGTVQPLATATVRARIDGQLERVDFTEGQDVRAGQVLAQLDARALRAQLEQARGQRARDQAQLGNARLDLARYEQLIRDEATTRQTLDTQRAQVAQLEAAVQTDEAQVHLAQVQLGYATLTAPFAGRTGARLVDPGNLVHASDANGIVVINRIDPIAVVFTLPGDRVQAIEQARRAGGPLAVLAYGRDGDALLARGQLVLVNNQIDPASGTIQLKGRFPNATHALWPGQYVNVRLQLGVDAQALTVPAAVVQRGQAGTYAYVVERDGTAQLRPIEVRRIQDGTAVIARGLRAGETVVVDGQYKIKPGARVVASPAGVPGPGAAR